MKLVIIRVGQFLGPDSRAKAVSHIASLGFIGIIDSKIAKIDFSLEFPLIFTPSNYMYVMFTYLLVFAIWVPFKGTLTRDFRTLFFHQTTSPDAQVKAISNMASNSRRWSACHSGVNDTWPRWSCLMKKTEVGEQILDANYLCAWVPFSVLIICTFQQKKVMQK
jgi:hypothetical protein